MGKRIWCVLTLALLLILPGLELSSQTPSKAVDFRADIQPILTANCIGCHQGSTAPAELHLDTPEGLLHGGTSGAVVIPGVNEAIDQNDAERTEQQIAALAAALNRAAKVLESYR